MIDGAQSSLMIIATIHDYELNDEWLMAMIVWFLCDFAAPSTWRRIWIAVANTIVKVNLVRQCVHLALPPPYRTASCHQDDEPIQYR